MKKIFLFLSAVLVATSLCATPIKQSIDLSAVEKYGTVTWNAETKTIETDEKNYWAGVHTNTTLDATGYSKLVLVLKEGYETVNVNLTVEYSGGTPASQSITNVAGLKTICIPLNGTNISDIIIRVTNYSSSAVLDELYLYKVIGIEEEVNLFEGSHAFGNWSWLPLYDDLSKYNSLHEGDKVVINYTSKGENPACQVRICTSNAQLNQAGEYVDISDASQVEFELCEEDIAALKANGMYLNGTNLTITKVSLLTYSQQIMVERVLNTGEEKIDWTHQHWVHASGLPTLAAGDELRVTVSAVTGEYPQVNFRHDDNGNNPVVIEGIDATVPKVYSVSLTAAQANDINSGKLFIVGQNDSLSHFAIAQPMSIYDENLLWYGEDAAGDDWGTPVNLPASKFSSVEVGDILNVLLTELDAEGQLFLTQGNYADFTVKPNFYLNGNCAAPMTLSFVINASMKDELQANGLLVSGKKFTVSAVYVLKAVARTESYFLKVSDAEMATLVLPFNATLPAGVEAYRLTYEGSNAIEATAVSAIQADKPVLIIAAANTDPGYEFVSEEGADTTIFYKNKAWSIGTYADGALHGNYANEFSIPNKYEIESVMNYFYVLQNGVSGGGFYQLQYWGDVKINPYRAFLSCTLNLNGFDTPDSAPGRKMRIVFHKDGTTGVESVQSSAIGNQKILRNGQLFILRNGVEYNVNGQMTK